MDSCQPSDNGVSASNILFVHKFLSSLSCFQSTTETEKCKQEQRAHQHTLKTVSAAAAHSSLKSQDSTHLQEAARCGTNPQQSPHNSSIVGGGLMLLARNWNDRPPPFPDYRAHIPVAQTSKQKQTPRGKAQGHPPNARSSDIPTSCWQTFTRWLPARYNLRPQRALL